MHTESFVAAFNRIRRCNACHEPFEPTSPGRTCVDCRSCPHCGRLFGSVRYRKRHELAGSCPRRREELPDIGYATLSQAAAALGVTIGEAYSLMRSRAFGPDTMDTNPKTGRPAQVPWAGVRAYQTWRDQRGHIVLPPTKDVAA